MVTITLNSEVAEKLEKLKREGETLNDVIKRIVETYEELMDYIDEKWEKLQRDKEKFIDLEDYASSRGL
jgi:predicted CopG family antitoxin